MTLTPAQLDDLKHFLSDVKIGTSTEHELNSDEAAWLLSLIDGERWIPVSELPEHSGEYLCQVDFGRLGFCFIIMNYSTEGGLWLDDFDTELTVTHWKQITPPTEVA